MSDIQQEYRSREIMVLESYCMFVKFGVSVLQFAPVIVPTGFVPPTAYVAAQTPPIAQLLSAVIDVAFQLEEALVDAGLSA